MLNQSSPLSIPDSESLENIINSNTLSFKQAIQHLNLSKEDVFTAINDLVLSDELKLVDEAEKEGKKEGFVGFSLKYYVTTYVTKAKTINASRALRLITERGQSVEGALKELNITGTESILTTLNIIQSAQDEINVKKHALVSRCYDRIIEEFTHQPQDSLFTLDTCLEYLEVPPHKAKNILKLLGIKRNDNADFIRY